ncbi:hypothetical protein D3C86_1765270 [compost metagenome]
MNSSKWMRSGCRSWLRRLSRTHSVISCGPQMKAAVRFGTSSQRENSASHLAASMRPLYRSMSCCSRLNTKIRLRRSRYWFFRSSSCSRKMVLPLERLP